MFSERESTDWYADVLEFHHKFGCFVGETPGYPGAGIHNLRARLVIEEWNELARAAPDDGRDADIPEMADAIVDLIYVLIGLSIAYGMDLRPLWKAVHIANLKKAGGEKRPDGKCLKPPGWVAPDIAGLLREQGWEPSEAR